MWPTPQPTDTRTKRRPPVRERRTKAAAGGNRPSRTPVGVRFACPRFPRPCHPPRNSSPPGPATDASGRWRDAATRRDEPHPVRNAPRFTGHRRTLGPPAGDQAPHRTQTAPTGAQRPRLPRIHGPPDVRRKARQPTGPRRRLRAPGATRSHPSHSRPEATPSEARRPTACRAPRIPARGRKLDAPRPSRQPWSGAGAKCWVPPARGTRRVTGTRGVTGTRRP
ncbi:hypothetical protein SAFG77S_05685 [Streptomyces afghaniensis]